MARFAEGTMVSVEKSRVEIEKLITRYGATSTAFTNAPGRAIARRRIRRRAPVC
jgi:hypothetical protein